mmetsp:Transcript_6003/g.11005  ORF Transcript_6003/g.11005 Transcript_6003/m.11005 type:complete len:269 (-) Transcript_6003:1980-2786(-)
MLLESRVDDLRDVQQSFHSIPGAAAETTSNIEQIHCGDAHVRSHVKHTSCQGDGHAKSVRIAGAASHVKAHPDDVETQLRRLLQQVVHLAHLSAILVAQVAPRVRVVRSDSQKHVRPWVVGLDLEKLALRVKSRQEGVRALHVSQVTGPLARIRIHHPVRGDPKVKNRIQFHLRGTVETGTKCCKRRQNSGVWVALDCIERLHSGKKLLPCLHSPVDVAQIKHVKGVLETQFYDFGCSILIHPRGGFDSLCFHILADKGAITIHGARC